MRRPIDQAVVDYELHRPSPPCEDWGGDLGPFYISAIRTSLLVQEEGMLGPCLPSLPAHRRPDAMANLEFDIHNRAAKPPTQIAGRAYASPLLRQLRARYIGAIYSAFLLSAVVAIRPIHRRRYRWIQAAPVNHRFAPGPILYSQ